SSKRLTSTIRTEGRPSGAAVATAAASGSSTPASCASPNHASNCASGSDASSARRSGRERGSLTARSASAPSGLQQLPHLGDAGLPDREHLLVGTPVEPAERPVADQLANPLGARDAVGGLVEHRLRLRGRLHSGEPRPREIRAPV